jgi:type II secretory pathway pseudopilin PulG
MTDIFWLAFVVALLCVLLVAVSYQLRRTMDELEQARSNIATLHRAAENYRAQIEDERAKNRRLFSVPTLEVSRRGVVLYEVHLN